VSRCIISFKKPRKVCVNVVICYASVTEPLNNTDSFTWLDSKSNQALKSLTKWVCADTGKLRFKNETDFTIYSSRPLGALLMDSQIKYYYIFGGERVVFDKDDVAKIKTIDTPGIVRFRS